jgi:hypothetical protein
MTRTLEELNRQREKRAQEYKAATTDEKRAKAEDTWSEYAKFRGGWNEYAKRRSTYHLKKWAADIKWEHEYRSGMDTTLNGQRFSNPMGTRGGDITMRELLEPPITSYERPGYRLEPKNPRVDWSWWKTAGPAPNEKARVVERHGQPWPVDEGLGLKWAAETSKPGPKMAALGSEDIRKNIASFLH